ncbi:putative cation/H+ exchanger, cation/H+ exchanger, CPA1 family, na+/H+ exchanger NHX -type [Rosa chinensis]|uniref:Putative cation/H+ exchanger, cation/H+ exchanger, CPA1 family, na+/H+ exchanger NHX-type n=1 Tax=Rosa chinensis TaxID=74649 RepID=A0A2P6QGL6_ROSCH|nr:putative cation/H+ exchanger, cation/H+ exchanger, CPA1 family, na+/H+ exchanger NHX -type [Rosa chinensis]
MAELYDFAKNLAHDHAQVVPISLFVAVLCICLVVGHLLEENRWVNESITAIFIGLLTGIIILLVSNGKSSHILTFNEELFFIYLLPPIIFNAGYSLTGFADHTRFQVKKKQFFQNFLTIMLFGVIGVFISTLVITAGNSIWIFILFYCQFLKFFPTSNCSLHCHAVGTIFSSTDTVCTLQVLHQDETPLLYSLVFGEGVVNDATSVVLFNAVQKIDVNKLNSGIGLRVIGDFLYLFSTSTALGVAFGLVTAYSLKTLCFGRHSSIREVSLVVLMAYLSYMVAELLDLSGILTVFFCGIVMHVFAMMSFIAETFIFLYVGMDALDIEKWKLTKLSFGASMGIYSMTLLLILLGRAAFVFPLSAFSNYMNRRASRRYNHMVGWANKRSCLHCFGFQTGMRTSFYYTDMLECNYFNINNCTHYITRNFFQHVKFTYSGVTLDPINAMMITNTIIVVLFSTVVFGFLTKPLISYLLPHVGTKPISRNVSKDVGEDLNLPLLSFDESTATNISRAKDNLSMLMERPVYAIHSYWRRFDDAYMRPLFGGPAS